MAGDAQVYLFNQFGDVNITSWNKNVVQIEISVLVEGDDKEIVAKQLDKIRVELSGTRDEVYAKTLIENLHKSGLSIWKKKAHFEFKIDYDVKMPVSNKLKVANKYGDLYLDDINGPSDIQISYGSMHVGALYNEHNNIELKYSRDCKVKTIKTADLNLSYSGIEIDSSGKLEVEARSSDCDLQKVSVLDYYGRYDKLVVNKVHKAKIDGRHSGIDIDDVLEKLIVDVDYGELRVDNVAKNFDVIEVESTYGPVRIVFANDAQFAFNTKTSGCGTTYPANATITNKDKTHSSSVYSGYVGRKESRSRVSVDSRYGSVKLKVD